MNAALHKEVRQLLPAWVAALVAATVPVWVMGADLGSMEQISFIFFAGGALLLSLSSFGLEMSLGTFPSLLAQPRPRLNTWELKIGLLGVALALVAMAAAYSWRLRVLVIMSDNSLAWNQRYYMDAVRVFWHIHVGCLSLLAAMAFSGGLWTTLLLRQTVAAFWFAILVPLVLYGASLPLIEPQSQDDNGSYAMAILTAVFCGYATGGYFFARWLFLHAQDKQAHEATATATLSFLPTFATPRRPVPVAALLIKELRMQDGMLMIAAVLVLLHLAALVTQAHLPATMASKFPFLGDFWMVWWVVPLLVGCVSIAEERRGRTLEGTLCLPVGRICQFAIKLLVIFGLGVFLGAVMPWLLEQLRPENLNHATIKEPGLPSLLLTSAIITAVGCYASSLSGTLLQALGAAIGLSLLSAVTFSLWLADSSELAHSLWSFIWPLLAATFFLLSYANFKQLRITWRPCLRNGVVWLVVLGPPIILFIAKGIPYFIYYWKK